MSSPDQETLSARRLTAAVARGELWLTPHARTHPPVRSCGRSRATARPGIQTPPDAGTWRFYPEVTMEWLRIPGIPDGAILDGAVAELHRDEDGIIVAEIRIPGPAVP